MTGLVWNVDKLLIATDGELARTRHQRVTCSGEFQTLESSRLKPSLLVFTPKI